MLYIYIALLIYLVQGVNQSGVFHNNHPLISDANIVFLYWLLVL